MARVRAERSGWGDCLSGSGFLVVFVFVVGERFSCMVPCGDCCCWCCCWLADSAMWASSSSRRVERSRILLASILSRLSLLEETRRWR